MALSYLAKLFAVQAKLSSILWSDRVSRFETKFAECNNSFYCKFHIQFGSLHLSLVKLLFMSVFLRLPGTIL